MVYICYYVGAKLFGLGNHIYLVFKNELCSTDIQKTRKRNVCGLLRASCLFYCPNMAETERFELSCQLPGKRISSAPRYDHFDTSPNAPYCNRLALNIQLKALCNNVKVRQTLCFYAILPWHPHRRDNLREQGRNQLMFPLPGW